MVGLPAKLVRDHGPRRLQAAGDRYPLAPTLKGSDERREVSVARKQYEVVEVAGDLHRIDGDLEIHVSLDLAAPLVVGELLRGLAANNTSVVKNGSSSSRGVSYARLD
jgi:hypothetical protein